jgi:hypothetical protein
MDAYQKIRLMIKESARRCDLPPSDPHHTPDFHGAYCFCKGYIGALTDFGLLTSEQSKDLRDLLSGSHPLG